MTSLVIFLILCKFLPANHPGFLWIVQEFDHLSRGPGIRWILPFMVYIMCAIFQSFV